MIVEELVLGRLLSLKLWGPLFEERANSFIAIIGQITTNLLAHLVVEGPRKFLFLACKERLLHRADRQRRPLRDLLLLRLHGCFELGGRYVLISLVDLQRSLRINHIGYYD